MARPIKLNAAIADRIVSAVRAGNYLTTAVAYGGIVYQTFLNWMERGEKDLKAGKRGQFVEFLERIKKAEADAEVEAVLELRRAGPREYRAALEYLARRHPKRWGRPSGLSINVPPGGANEDGEAIASDDVIEVHLTMSRGAKSDAEVEL